jgi:hypothetical protein
MLACIFKFTVRDPLSARANLTEFSILPEIESCIFLSYLTCIKCPFVALDHLLLYLLCLESVGCIVLRNKVSVPLDIARQVITKMSVSFSPGYRLSWLESFSWFSSVTPANTGIVPSVRPRPLMPYPFQVTHWLSYHSTQKSWATDIVVK